jgi:hypothetical protein
VAIAAKTGLSRQRRASFRGRWAGCRGTGGGYFARFFFFFFFLFFFLFFLVLDSTGIDRHAAIPASTDDTAMIIGERIEPEPAHADRITDANMLAINTPSLGHLDLRLFFTRTSRPV